jgi:hypothetical protein
MKLNAIGEHRESYKKFAPISANIWPKSKQFQILNLHITVDRMGRKKPSHANGPLS